MKNFADTILHIPHSSGSIEVGDLAKWSGDIESCIRRLTDWHTDKLFASELDGVYAMVIEVNKSVYLDVDGVAISAGLQRINELLNQFYKIILQ